MRTERNTAPARGEARRAWVARRQAALVRLLQLRRQHLASEWADWCFEEPADRRMARASRRLRVLYRHEYSAVLAAEHALRVIIAENTEAGR